MEAIVESLPALLGITVLVALTTVALTLYRVPHRWAPAGAVLRGTLQLAAISLVLAGVLTDPLWVAVALVVMFSVAVITSTRRIGFGLPRLGVVAAGMGAGVTVALVVVFATGAVEPSPRYALAMGGIVIGNTMTIAGLVGSRLEQSIAERWDEVEGWLALGATPRQATLDLARHAVHSALIPSTDQTKTTGLVTLPGAFVGAIFGGLSPLDAGRFQIVVLASIMAAGAVAAVVIAHALAPVRQRPAARD
ncbi:ABC transporter permease [Herbiconiux sp. SYSU D00978]|uniref:ABC transporter permease n=1 Tax=Herbiconiux sp. SYSU D00978 TaxID=2812562 RepID=UPI001A972F3B|nr:ABC transporter permease [Herbiconiux sp. SYSU D00978]